MRRRNLIEEDEYVSKKIINGVPEYNEFKIGMEEEEEVEAMSQQTKLNRDILRFCVLRIFRPDLVVEQIKRYIDIFLDSSFTTLPAFSYADIMKNSDHDQANLMVVGSNVDA